MSRQKLTESDPHPDRNGGQDTADNDLVIHRDDILVNVPDNRRCAGFWLFCHMLLDLTLLSSSHTREILIIYVQELVNYFVSSIVYSPSLRWRGVVCRSACRSCQLCQEISMHSNKDATDAPSRWLAVELAVGLPWDLCAPGRDWMSPPLALRRP
jgi:hypothetical protein